MRRSAMGLETWGNWWWVSWVFFLPHISQTYCWRSWIFRNTNSADIKSPNKSLLSLTKEPKNGSLARQKTLDNNCCTPNNSKKNLCSFCHPCLQRLSGELTLPLWWGWVLTRTPTPCQVGIREGWAGSWDFHSSHPTLHVSRSLNIHFHLTVPEHPFCSLPSSFPWDDDRGSLVEIQDLYHHHNDSETTSSMYCLWGAVRMHSCPKNPEWLMRSQNSYTHPAVTRRQHPPKEAKWKTWASTPPGRKKHPLLPLLKQCQYRPKPEDLNMIQSLIT